jgi:thioredoxin 1
MMPRIEELKRRMGTKLKVVLLDIDSPANEKAIEHFRINGTPTFILFKDGKQLWRDAGERSTDQLMDIIEEHI